MKRCSRCGLEKPLTEFYRVKNRPGGYEAQCKECRRARMRDQRDSDTVRERERERARRSRQTNPEKHRAATRRHYHRNKDQIAAKRATPEAQAAQREYDKRYREKNRDAVNARARAWREANPEQAREVQERSYSKNRDSVLERSRDWATDHPEERKCSAWMAYARKNGATIIERIWPDDLLQRDVGRCGICGEPVDESYEIDHIIPLFHGGQHVFDNVQLAHAPCNLRKGRSLT